VIVKQDEIDTIREEYIELRLPRVPVREESQLVAMTRSDSLLAILPLRRHPMKKPRVSSKTRQYLLVLLSLLIVTAPVLGAQQRGSDDQPSVDSLARLLDSPDFYARGMGVDYVNHMPAENVPPTLKTRMIALLESEALEVIQNPSSEPSEDGSEGEGYGEYLGFLADGVLRFNDPRSLRGMALIGLTSKVARQFVASQGSASLPYLDEAWATETGTDVAVARTWALMLGTYSNRFTHDELVAIRRRIFGGLSARPLAFAWAAQTAPLPEAVSVLDAVATTGEGEILRSRAAHTAAELRPKRDALSPKAVLSTLDMWLDAFCVAPQGARNGACQSLDNLLANATKHVEAGRNQPAANVLRAFADRADQALAQGAFTASESRLLAENARYLAGRM
jgi:hypothetical protein